MRIRSMLAAVVAAALLFGIVSPAVAVSTVAPGGFADSQSSPQARALAYLKAFNVLRGDAGTNNVRPNDPLNREEFVAIVVRATGNEALASGLAATQPNFADAAQISSWAVGPVQFATSQGWIKGYEDGTFRPKGHLTMAEAITVLVRATGHERLIPGTATWPVGHLLRGNQVGITAGVTVEATRPITRQDMARLTYNALFIPTAYVTAGTVRTDGPSLAAAVATIHTGRVTEVNPGASALRLRLSNPAPPPASTTLNLTMADAVTLIGAGSFAGLAGLDVRVTVDAAGKAYIIDVAEPSSEVKGTFRAAAGGSATARTDMELTDGTRITITATTAVTVNGRSDPIGPGSAWWATVHEFLTDPDDGMQAGDEVTAVLDADGNALSVDIVRLTKNDLPAAKYAANYLIASTTMTPGSDPDVMRVYRHDHRVGSDPRFGVGYRR